MKKTLFSSSILLYSSDSLSLSRSALYIGQSKLYAPNNYITDTYTNVNSEVYNTCTCVHVMYMHNYVKHKTLLYAYTVSLFRGTVCTGMGCHKMDELNLCICIHIHTYGIHTGKGFKKYVPLSKYMCILYYDPHTYIHTCIIHVYIHVCTLYMYIRMCMCM